MNVGLALSGGGVRAIGFHLGVLDRLASENLLEEVSFISTVSGGSLCVGLIYSASEYKWPSSSHFQQVVKPCIRRLLTSQDLQLRLILRLIKAPHHWLRSAASDLSTLISQLWGINANLQDIPDHPRWIINSTTYETGKNWRFMSRRMGDYLFGYSLNPDIPLSDAIAASAGHPLIGPLVLDTGLYSWVRYKEGSQTETEPITPGHKKILLWDGGIYDNLGIEALFKPVTGNRSGIDFLIVSDASAPLRFPGYWIGFPSALRLYDITSNQSQSYRTRVVVEYMKEYNSKGRYLQIGNTCSHILTEAKRKNEIGKLCSDCLPDAEVKKAEETKTSLRNLDEKEFDRLLRHGFEVTDLTLHAYGSGHVSSAIG